MSEKGEVLQKQYTSCDCIDYRPHALRFGTIKLADVQYSTKEMRCRNKYHKTNTFISKPYFYRCRIKNVKV